MNLDCKDTLLRVTEGVAKRGYEKFSNASQELRSKRLHPALMSKIVARERLGRVFSKKRYSGKNGKFVELFPLEVEKGGVAFLFVPSWSPRAQGGLNFKIFILAAKISGKQSLTVRFEEPGHRGTKHNYWHAQLSYGPETRTVSDAGRIGIYSYCWLPVTNPAIPLPIYGGQIDLLLVMLISVFGSKEMVEDEIKKCGFNFDLTMSIRKRLSYLVALRR